MITQNKITDIFCTVDVFGKKFDAEMAKANYPIRLNWFIQDADQSITS